MRRAKHVMEGVLCDSTHHPEGYRKYTGDWRTQDCGTGGGCGLILQTDRDNQGAQTHNMAESDYRTLNLCPCPRLRLRPLPWYLCMSLPCPVLT
ncbi:hypothetical protein J4Q44_G00196030, partial [Coregonus suidteri]